MSVATGNESEPSTSSSSMQCSQLCRYFKFGEILSATENFNESLEIGRGGFGTVYKGNIISGSTLVVAAIKRLDTVSSQGAPEFWAEVEMLSKLRHCHLVSLIGYCNYEREMILVYEYMPNGTLEDHLHKLGSTISWCERLKICIGAARGLDYLHTGTGIEFGIIHRDVKSSNILLDESQAAKVSDFGLSKISPRNQPSTCVSTLVKGTFGYFDPHYFATGKLTRKSDVYAFAVVLLEVLCRKRAVDNSLDWGIATWAQDSIKEGRLKDIVDFEIRGEISPKCLKEFARIAERCLDNHPKHRPTMAEVVVSLEYVLTLQEKTNTLLQTTGKTLLGRMVDKFTFTSNAGMDFGSVVPKRRYEQKLSNMGKHFTFSEIKDATNNFDEARLLGVGAFSKVYEGEINGGNTKLTIKRGKLLSDKDVKEFITEFDILSKLRHPHLVSLIGYCKNNSEMILVYDYMAHGSLSEHLYKRPNNLLTWKKRLEICIDAARGLHYLHTGAKQAIIHRDVKTSNILLDDRWIAKVSDFGLSKTGPTMDLEYHQMEKLTEKSDVYSFGIVLLEILSGQADIDLLLAKEKESLAKWALNYHKKGILDPYLRGKIDPECFKKVVETALKCLADDGMDRPSMGDVLWNLDYALFLQQRPLK